MSELNSVLNLSNDGNERGHYPLFLGDRLGFHDTINVTFPEIREVFKLQQSQYWLPDEIGLESDRLDIEVAPRYETETMTLNLLAQWLLDSVAARSILETFGPFITNSELHSWFLAQTFFEDIHAETYSKIIRNCYSDSNDVLTSARRNIDVFNRVKIFGEVFHKINKIGGLYSAGIAYDQGLTIYDIKKSILEALVALYSLEQISFIASFACTFALCETGRYQGIGKNIALIARDEQVHAKGDSIVIQKAIQSDPDFAKIFDENRGFFNDILDAAVDQEYRWAEYVFSDGRKVVGLNTDLLREYVQHTSLTAYNDLGLDWDTDRFGTASKSNPLSFMDTWLDMNKKQNANMEIENTNYRVGQVVDDLGGATFDF